jgi:hypothetical protein
VEKGYEVTAFEPCAPLAAAMFCRFAERLNIKVYRARYEDMPQLFSARPNAPSTTLGTGPDFGAAVLGWGSFSHLRTEAQRIRTLSSFARYVRGPILVSFFQKPQDNAGHTGWVRSLIRNWLTHAAELECEANQSGLKIVYLNVGGTADNSFPHAVLAGVGHSL